MKLEFVRLDMTLWEKPLVLTTAWPDEQYLEYFFAVTKRDSARLTYSRGMLSGHDDSN